MNEESSLQPHFAYWDDFVSHWFKCGGQCCIYLPEPWWGWTPKSHKPLHSVVINLNPGKGGSKQTRQNLAPILDHYSYSEAMQNSLPKKLYKTHNWHSNHRAKPIQEEIADLAITDAEYISHHLSIELSPLHSLTSQSVEEYVKSHFEDVVAHTLRFAADSSRLIDGPLHRIVIVRCSAQRFRRMFDSLNLQPCISHRDTNQSPYWCRIDSPGFEDVEFVCVWGARNELPKKDIKGIINKNLIKKK